MASTINATTASGGGVITTADATGNLNIQANGANVISILNNGTVGIGITAPLNILHVASGDPTVMIENTAASSNARLKLKYPSRTWQLSVRGADLSGAFAIRDETSNVDRMVIDSSGNVGINTTSPVSKLSINGNYSISATAAGSGTIDCSSGNYFTRTITGTETITFANVPTTGNAYSFTLVLTNGGSAAITWGSTPKWPSGTAPTLTSSGVDILVFFTSDGGTTWRGNLVQKDSK
jgi:hypothetical protein